MISALSLYDLIVILNLLIAILNLLIVILFRELRLDHTIEHDRRECYPSTFTCVSDTETARLFHQDFMPIDKKENV